MKGARGPRLVDLSHTVRDGMITYRGLPGPVVRDHLSRRESREHYAEGTEFQVGMIQMVGNTGTYLDTPFHRFEGGRDLAALPLERVADLDGVLIEADVGAERAISRESLAGPEVSGRAVLIRTGWDRHWGTDGYFEGHPFLTGGAAAYLAEAGAALVGIDSLNVDDTEDGRRPVHTTLLGRGIPIVEHLTGLERLWGHRFRFSAVPVKVAGLGSFPVRAFAIVAGEE